MNQSKHLFQFSAKQIAAACEAEVKFREERIAYWEAEQQHQVERARGLTSTVEIREWSHTSGKGYQVVAVLVDIQDINQRLDMCGTKIYGHQQKRDEYRLKGGAYASQDALRAYELDPEDVAYFKLDGAARKE